MRPNHEPDEHTRGHTHEPRHDHPVLVPKGAVEGTRIRGQEFLYVPGEILVASALLDSDEPGAVSIRRALERFSHDGDRDEPSPGTTRVRVPFRSEGLLAFIDDLRTLTDPPTYDIGLNAVFWPEFHRTYFPAMAPTSIPKGSRPRRTRSNTPTVTVGVVDFGLLEHAWLSGRASVVAGEPFEQALPPRRAGGRPVLDLSHGHGTFVAGVVAQACPSARIVHCRAVGASGHLDDPAIAAALWRLAFSEKCSIIVAPLGGFTPDNTAPLAITAVLDRIDTAGLDCVVVAAAGNHVGTRPVWPAATKRVVAVAGTVDATGAPAAYSSRGDWVDVCAPGSDVVSAFYTGDFELLHPDAQPTEQTFDGWARWSGTSFAAPLVAARLAAMVGGGSTARHAAAALRQGPVAHPGFGPLVT